MEKLFAYLRKFLVFFFIVIALLSVFPGRISATTKHDIYFPNTQYELNVYRIYGNRPGKTLLIIGGIQGNEPGGYLAADLYADMSLDKGNLIVVPRANFYSILLNKRGPNGDMNRKFTLSSSEDYDEKIVTILKRLISQSDYLLNLHDGSGFYSPEWISDLKNPRRFGQSIIADANSYYSKKSKKNLLLGDLAKKISRNANEYIENPDYLFHFNNHQTSSVDTLHAEQRKSATYYALTHHGIPAFGVETSKSLPVKLRIKFQTIVINAFMEELGIVPENPRVYLDPPLLKYLVISINDSVPLVVFNNKTLIVKRGNSIEISHVEANYTRGLSVDILNLGTKNDYRKKFIISNPTKVIVRKDKYKCGQIRVSLDSRNKRIALSEYSKETSLSGVKYFIVEINGIKRIFYNDEQFKLVKGDKIKILDVAISTPDLKKDMIVNFLGFVGNKTKNTGEDRGYMINTTKDLWKRYSTGKKGNQYQIVAESNNNKLGMIQVNLVEPVLHYLAVKTNGKKGVCYKNGEVIEVHKNDFLEIVDFSTNIVDNFEVKVNFKGYMGGNGEDDRKRIITLNGNLKKEYALDQQGKQYEILITRDELVIGRVIVKIG